MIFRRFSDWAWAGIFDNIFNVLSDDPDMEVAMVDGTIVKVLEQGCSRRARAIDEDALLDPRR